jgi:hypothetical protein
VTTGRFDHLQKGRESGGMVRAAERAQVADNERSVVDRCG